jgi:ABC-type multidrug transport system fused ATPase/permease subunit
MINQCFNFIGSVIQLCFSSPYLVIVVGVVAIIFYPLQAFYRKTSIELQRLEAISRSPIITHLSETLDGAQSIRAFNMRKNFKTVSLNHLDENNVDMVSLRYCSAWYVNNITP